MKKLIVLTFTVICFSSCSQDIEEKIQGNWLMTFSYPDSVIEIENPLVYSGNLLSINKGQLSVHHINYQDTLFYKYTIDNQNLILEDSTVFQIVSLPPNKFSLRIDNGHIHDLIEIPFGNYYTENFDPEILYASSWLLTIDEYDYEFRLEFSKSKHRNFQDATFDLFSWAERDFDFLYRDFSLRWRYFTIRNQSFLSLALFPDKSVPYQIISQSKDTIYLKTCDVDSCIYPYLHRIEGIASDSLAKIREVLVNKTWEVTQIDYPGGAVDFVNNTITEETQKFIHKHKMSFKFGRHSLTVLTNQSISDTVSWDLTDDGKFVKLYEDGRFIGYVEIVDIKKERIVLSNSIFFAFLMELQNLAMNKFTITME